MLKLGLALNSPLICITVLIFRLEAWQCQSRGELDCYYMQAKKIAEGVESLCKLEDVLGVVSLACIAPR